MTDFYKGKKVLVTGHTGFKGTWLTKMLLMAGAEVTGYSLDPPTEPSLFELSDMMAALGERSIIGDVRDLSHLSHVFEETQPEIVFHLAAQPIVRESYKDPVRTFETNVMGTVNICECVRKTHLVRSFVNVTTDKVYLNSDGGRLFKEGDPLCGLDPYSNSKSCSELVTYSYINSFFKTAENGPVVSTVRAGNVIGGGDFASDRIVPDCVRATVTHTPLVLRNPNSVRPYQHVLEAVSLYLTIAEEQYKDPFKAGSYNIGPDEEGIVTTGELAELFKKYYGNGFTYEAKAEKNAPHEAALLKLDTSLVKRVFDWKPTWNIDEAVRRTVEWTKEWQRDPSPENINRAMEKQIRER